MVKVRDYVISMLLHGEAQSLQLRHIGVPNDASRKRKIRAVWHDAIAALAPNSTRTTSDSSDYQLIIKLGLDCQQ